MAVMTSPGDIATGVAPSRLNDADWNSEAKMRSFLPLKSSSLRIASFTMTSDCSANADGDAVQTLVGAEPEIKFQHLRIGGDLLGLRRRGDQTGRGQHFETFVDADKKLGRDDCALDRAELGAFDLPRDGSPAGSPDRPAT